MAVKHCEFAGVATVSTNSDVSDTCRAKFGAVGAPELSVAAFIARLTRAEVEVAIEHCEFAGVAAPRTIVDVSDTRRAQRRAVGAPEFSSAGAVVGAEVDVAIEGGEVVRVEASGAAARLDHRDRWEGRCAGRNRRNEQQRKCKGQ